MVVWFQIFLSNNFQTSIWPINGIFTHTTTPGQCESERNGNEEVLHTPQSSKTGASFPDAIEYHTQDTPLNGGGGSYSSAGDTVSAF